MSKKVLNISYFFQYLFKRVSILFFAPMKKNSQTFLLNTQRKIDLEVKEIHF